MGKAGTFALATTACLFAVSTVALGAAPPAPAVGGDFETPGSRTWVVPAGVASITVIAEGAAGGSTGCDHGAAGGRGGRVTATVAVVPGEVLRVEVGAIGGAANPGGGTTPGGAGGGASGVTRAPNGLGDRLVVAGAGGGAGGGCPTTGEPTGGSGGDGGAPGSDGVAGSTGAGGGAGGGAGATGGLGIDPGPGGQQNGAPGVAGSGGSGGTADCDGGGGGGNGATGGGGGGAGGDCGGGGGGGGGSSLGPPSATFENGVVVSGGRVRIEHEPVDVPGAPRSVAARSSSGQAAVSFDAPPSDGGSPITSYRVVSDPGGLSATGSASPITVAGLTDGVEYRFRVQAVNAVGGGPLSEASNPVIPGSTVVVKPDTLATVPARVGASLDVSLTLSNGAIPIWRIGIGSLPPGVTLTESGRVTGAPTAAGAFSFVIAADVAGDPTVTKGTTLLVAPPLSTGYETRRAQVIGAQLSAPFPAQSGCTAHIGYLTYATAALWLENDVAGANDKLAQVDVDRIAGRECSPGQSLERNLRLNLMLRPYLLFSSSSTTFPGRLSTAAEANLLRQAWEYTSIYSKVAEAPDVWNIQDSENHDVMRETFHLLAAQVLKNRPEYRDGIYADGKRAADHYEAWRAHFLTYFDERIKRGLFIEVASPTYHGYTLQSILNVYNFAEDPVLRKKAKILLDIDFADFAQQHLFNVWGGAKSRAFTDQTVDGVSDSMRGFGDLLYGPKVPKPDNHVLALATSGYYPSSVIADLHRNVTARGTYEYLSRRPGAGTKTTVNGELIYGIDAQKSLLKVDFVTPRYVLGGFLQAPSISFTDISSQNRWQGIVFGTSLDARVFPQVGYSAPDNVTYSNFSAAQKRNVLVTAKKGNTALPTLIYFAKNLNLVVENSSWLFVEEGGAYLAVRPLDGGYSWLTAAKNQATVITDRFIRLTNGATPVIFEAALASSYSSFDAFQADIKSNALSYVNGTAEYTGNDGTRITLYIDNRAPMINGTAVNFAPGRVYDSPYLRSDWGSGVVTVSFEGRSIRYDVRDPYNPLETEGTAAPPPPPTTTPPPTTPPTTSPPTTTTTRPPALPSLSVNDVSVKEGTAGARPTLSFTVRLPAARTTPVVVRCATSNGSAVAPGDYQALAKDVTIPAGATSTRCNIVIVGDNTREGNEKFTLRLSNPRGATIADASAIGTITNDD